jgi:hypothetical protein
MQLKMCLCGDGNFALADKIRSLGGISQNVLNFLRTAFNRPRWLLRAEEEGREASEDVVGAWQGSSSLADRIFKLRGQRNRSMCRLCSSIEVFPC